MGEEGALRALAWIERAALGRSEGVGSGRVKSRPLRATAWISILFQATRLWQPSSAPKGRNHASNNLAKLPFLFETAVPRARLRTKYGQGFGRKSGRETAKRVTPGR